MSYFKSNRQKSQSSLNGFNGFGSDETFIVDLENKVDSLKNISTNINNELQKSKVHLSSLSKGFDSASLSIKTTLHNMNKIAKGYTSRLPLWALALMVAFVLLLFVVLFKKIFFR